MLEGNRDLDNVIVVPQRPSVAEMAALIARLWRRYDLALATHAGDRPTLLAWAAGWQSVGPVEGDGFAAAWWKRLVLGDVAPTSSDDRHRVLELLRLAAVLGIARRNPGIVCPAGAVRRDSSRRIPMRSCMPSPCSHTSAGRSTAGGCSLRRLRDRGLIVAATGGPDPAEKDYLDRIWSAAEPPVMRLDGKLGWPDLAALLRGAARVYVGPDTAVTHLAAAAGTPTVALYGPTDPRVWGPWPVGGLETPWARAGTIQRRGNVWVVQNPLPCMPCDKLEGCERRLDSHSQCLDELSVVQVVVAVDQALARRGAGALRRERVSERRETARRVMRRSPPGGDELAGIGPQIAADALP